MHKKIYLIHKAQVYLFVESWHPKGGMELREVITHHLSHLQLRVIPGFSFECSLELRQTVPHSLRGLGTELHESSVIKEQRRLYLSTKM